MAIQILNPRTATGLIAKVKQDWSSFEILGTGFYVQSGPDIRVVTAKHVFEGSGVEAGHHFYITVESAPQRSALVRITRVMVSVDFDIAVGDVPEAANAGATTLPFASENPALNMDVLTHEFSGSRIERLGDGGTKITLEPSVHKGNIVREYVSRFPDRVPTPSYLTSFPALQGASGAPLLVQHAPGRQIAVVGMLVANVERHLLPAQVVRIEEGERQVEEVKYFLPQGKAIARQTLVGALREMGLNLVFDAP